QTNFQKALINGLSKVQLKDTLNTLEVFGPDLLNLDPTTFERMREFLQNSIQNFIDEKPTEVKASVIFEFEQELFKQKLRSKKIDEDTITNLTEQLQIYQKLAQTGELLPKQLEDFRNIQKSLLEGLSEQQSELNNIL